MDSLEKRIIYLKGISDGIIQGTNPNSSKYKLQVDKEIYLLQEQFNALQKKNIQNKPLQNTDFLKKSTSSIELNQNEEEKEEKEIIPYYVVTEEDYKQYQDISKKINSLKEMIFKNNNNIQLLNRNKTYQNSVKVQSILKQNVSIQYQIQQYQISYDLLNLKINDNQKYKNAFTPKKSIDKEPPKSILKSSSEKEGLQFKKHIQINTDKNEITYIPKSNISNNESIFNKPKSKLISRIKASDSTKVLENIQKDFSEENDMNMIKEFQSTLGNLQKLLI